MCARASVCPWQGLPHRADRSTCFLRYPRRMVRFAAALSLVLAACFSPTFNNPTCGPNGECPSGTTCMNGVCMTGGGDDDDDAAVDPDAIDAPPDLDAVDAPMGIDGAGFSVSYLPASASIPGTNDWIVNVGGMIDTTN